MTDELRFEGELISGQHHPSTRAAIERVEPIANSGSACNRYVCRYFSSPEAAQAAADVLTAEAQAGAFPDVRFVVIPARCSHR
jgi:hypothetical protein